MLRGVNPLAAFNPNDPDMNFFLRNNLEDLDWDAIAQDVGCYYLATSALSH